ncbi:hypothetical protein GPA10_22405 [Streptomyces sp. p1417]|uniref:DUF6884 domain-containing protein n=1 Tax=Streptomyces typhae TaxID=2681492 RepID=A0A6L6X0V7_9ACTN|nr:DUF6884 domain-containing protein [Streptomyces typhae]MVO87438.1 hypothetical protein [Streptomyces typhae]
MGRTKNLLVPGQLRRHVLKNVKPRSKGERDLLEACQDGARELEAQGKNTLNSIALDLTNDALGAAIAIARSWLSSDNGNNVMAGKSLLKFELEYEPDDPREKRYAIKMPKSLAGVFTDDYSNWDVKKHARLPKALKSDLQEMSWTATGASGRVLPETLKWLLDRVQQQTDHPTPAVHRAARKFQNTYTEVHEQAQRLIVGYLGTDEGEGQTEPEADEILTPGGFMEAIHGRGPELVQDEPKRLVVIACGGKKSSAPGKIPAETRYIGNYFRACLMAAEVMDGPTMILSAKYGLIPLTEEIENYSIKLGDKGSIRLGTVRDQAADLDLLGAAVTVLGGEKYVTGVRQIWPDAKAPLKGNIGQQLQQLAGMYEGEVLEDDESEDQGPEAAGPDHHYIGCLRDVPHLPSRGRPHQVSIWFAGKAGRGRGEPGRWRKVHVTYTGASEYDLTDVETGKSLLMCKASTRIHWSHLPETPERAGRSGGPQAPEPTCVEETSKQAGDYPVPENFLDLAEEGDTPQARAYWRRRCEQYRRTGE